MKLILGIIIGIVIVLSIKTVFAEQYRVVINDQPAWRQVLIKQQDGNVICYLLKTERKFKVTPDTIDDISCVKVK